MGVSQSSPHLKEEKQHLNENNNKLKSLTVKEHKVPVCKDENKRQNKWEDVNDSGGFPDCNISFKLEILWEV